jgi:hypothetical protein
MQSGLLTIVWYRHHRKQCILQSPGQLGQDTSQRTTFLHVSPSAQPTRSSLQKLARVGDDNAGQEGAAQDAIDDALAIHTLLSAMSRAH